MRYAVPLVFAISLFTGTSTVWAQDGALLMGCLESEGQIADGSTVAVAAADGPMRLNNGNDVFAADLIGRPCIQVLKLLLDNDLIDPDDIGASGHLVMGGTQGESRTNDGDDTDVPDCLIWDIDSAEVAYQLTCDPFGDMTIVAQSSAVGEGSSEIPTDFVGRDCIDALTDAGGLASVLRSSISRLDRGRESRQSSGGKKSIPVSVLLYQLVIKRPLS